MKHQLMHCATIVTLIAPALAFAAPDFCAPLTQAQIENNLALSDDAARLAPYAIMSNNAYPRGKDAIPLPEGWIEVSELRVEKPSVGLALAVFEKSENGKLVEAVVAFRGTDEMKDWIRQNLIPFHRDQVLPGSAEFERILKRYEPQHTKVTTTGHSLGGGLAFHMSFVYPNIEAIAFNSSPVTKAGFKVQKGNARTSASESGEILQLPRDVVKRVRVRWNDVKNLKFRFVHGLPLKQHSMELFAMNLVKLGAMKSTQLEQITKGRCM